MRECEGATAKMRMRIKLRRRKSDHTTLAIALSPSAFSVCGALYNLKIIWAFWNDIWGRRRTFENFWVGVGGSEACLVNLLCENNNIEFYRGQGSKPLLPFTVWNYDTELPGGMSRPLPLCMNKVCRLIKLKCYFFLNYGIN